MYGDVLRAQLLLNLARECEIIRDNVPTTHALPEDTSIIDALAKHPLSHISVGVGGCNIYGFSLAGLVSIHTVSYEKETALPHGTSSSGINVSSSSVHCKIYSLNFIVHFQTKRYLNVLLNYISFKIFKAMTSSLEGVTGSVRGD